MGCYNSVVDTDVQSVAVNHRRVSKVCDGELLTEQAHRDETNVNNIISRYRKTGQLSHVRETEGKYADVTHITAHDFQAAMDVVARAKSSFESMPAWFRAKFDNDPAKFLADVDAKEEYLRKQKEKEDKEVKAQPPEPPKEPEPAKPDKE